MMSFLSTHLARAAVRVAAALAAVVALLPLVRAAQQTPPVNAYIVVGLDTRHVLPIRTFGSAELVPLDQVTTMFGVSMAEDRLTNSATVSVKGQRIVLTSGQSLASVAGRLVSLSGPVTHDRTGWFVPVDFLSRILGPAMGQRIDVRRPSHLIAVGAASVAPVTTHIDRVAGGAARVTVETDSAVGHHVLRAGNQLRVQFDAAGIDAAATTGSAPEFVAGTHVDGNTLVIDLGPAAAGVKTSTDNGRVVVDLTPAPVPSAPAPGTTVTLPPAAPAQPPQQTVAPDLGPSAGVRTVIIDPGHGGDDTGVHAPKGSLEKDVTLQLAKRLKAAIESRLGIRALLTRDADESVTADKRTAFANNARGDLFISLHANASLRAGAHGASVYSLGLDQYKSRASEIGSGDKVPVVGGGTRLIQTVPWELAQLPFIDKSAAFSAAALRHLSAQNVPLFARASQTAPLVGLAGINMPAILLETGFLSNPDDEHELTSDAANAIVEALVDTITEVRNAWGTAPAPGSQPR